MTQDVIGGWNELHNERLGILILRVIAVGRFVGWEVGDWIHLAHGGTIITPVCQQGNDPSNFMKGG
jgi:hypothetical protein